MKKILAIAFVLISISTPTLFAKEWFCEYEEPNYRATRGIKVVGDAIIDTGSIGFDTKTIIRDVLISDDYIFPKK